MCTLRSQTENMTANRRKPGWLWRGLIELEQKDAPLGLRRFCWLNLRWMSVEYGRAYSRLDYLLSAHQRKRSRVG